MSAASFVRRRRCRCRCRCYPRLLRWSSSASSSPVSRKHLSFAAPEIQQQPRTLPWLMLSSPAKPQSRFLYKLSLDDHRFELDKELHLPEIAGNRCIGVSQGYMLTVPTRCSPDVVAVNPLTKARLPLPSTAGLPDLRISDGYLRDHKAIWERDDQATTVDSNHFGLINGKAILPPALDTIFLFRRYVHHQAFYACLSSSSPPSWTPLPIDTYKMNCVYDKGQFPVFEDAASFISTKEFGFQPLFCQGGDQLVPHTESYYLVESPDGEDLFKVHKMRYSDRDLETSRTITFLVFRLDKINKYKWEFVKSLGGLTFFVGANQSVSVLAADFPGLQSDSIYFTDDVPFGNFPSALSETGVFNLRYETSQFLRFTDEEIQLNWPPPMWYGSIAC